MYYFGLVHGLTRLKTGVWPPLTLTDWPPGTGSSHSRHLRPHEHTHTHTHTQGHCSHNHLTGKCTSCVSHTPCSHALTSVLENCADTLIRALLTQLQRCSVSSTTLLSVVLVCLWTAHTGRLRVRVQTARWHEVAGLTCGWTVPPNIKGALSVHGDES